MTSNLSRRSFTHLAAMACLTATGVVQAQGQVLRINVGFPPGGTLDVLARLLAPHFSQAGVTAIVENKPGASAQLAAVAVRQAPPEGMNLLLTPTSVMTLTSQLFRKPLIDPLRDLLPIGSVCEHPFAFAVTGNNPIKTMAEFITWAKAHPNEASYATPGAGTSPHFLGIVLAKAIGAPLAHVPYRGTAPALQDLMGGQIASTMNALPAMVDLHKAGRIRILATTGAKRPTALPDVKTFTELGIPGLEYAESFGVFAHAGTPPAIAGRLESMLQKAVASNEFAESARKLELELRGTTAAGYRQLVEADYKRWSGIAKESGFQLDA